MTVLGTIELDLKNWVSFRVGSSLPAAISQIAGQPSSPLASPEAASKFISSEQIQNCLVDVLPSVSATTVKLLRAASEILGGNKALAYRLGIDESLLPLFMADSHELPDPLLLRAVDIILTDRQSRPPSLTNRPFPQASTGET
jgi:hypothetical protein